MMGEIGAVQAVPVRTLVVGAVAAYSIATAPHPWRPTTYRLQCRSKALTRPRSLWLFRTFTKTCSTGKGEKGGGGNHHNHHPRHCAPVSTALYYSRRTSNHPGSNPPIIRLHYLSPYLSIVLDTMPEDGERPFAEVLLLLFYFLLVIHLLPRSPLLQHLPSWSNQEQEVKAGRGLEMVVAQFMFPLDVGQGKQY